MLELSSIYAADCDFPPLYSQNCPKIHKSSSSVPALPTSQLVFTRIYLPYSLLHSPPAHPFSVLAPVIKPAPSTLAQLGSYAKIDST